MAGPALLQRRYAKAYENRQRASNPRVKRERHAFLRGAAFNFILLQTVFLCLFAYLFGSLFASAAHQHDFNIIFVDYDGGAVAAAVRNAYQMVQGPGYPTLNEEPPQRYPDPASSLLDAVCGVKAWAALYVEAGASDRLDAALRGGSAAASYNNENVIRYIWNEARFPTVVDSSIAGNLNSLAESARVIWCNANINSTLIAAQSNDINALKTLHTPWRLTDHNIKPTKQGSRTIYNTLVVVLSLVQEFFYLGTVNGLYAQFKLYSILKPSRIAIFRIVNALLYGFIGSLCVTSMIYAYRDAWELSGAQFVLTWSTFWLTAHIHFLVLDLFTIWLTPFVVPMAMITWVVLNVTTTLSPFELAPGFYRWGWCLPSNALYNTLLDIWSAGCNPRLDISLPVLFSWWILGLIGTTIGVYRRCHYATIAREEQESNLQSKIDRAIAQERRSWANGRQLDQSSSQEALHEPAPEKSQTELAEENNREDEAEAEVERVADQELQALAAARFGPTFAVPFGRPTGRSTLQRSVTAPIRRS